MSEEHWTKDTPEPWKVWAARSLVLGLVVLWLWWLDNADVALGVLACGYALWLGVVLWRRWRAA